MSTTSLSAEVIDSVSLYLRSGVSDKEYHLYRCKHLDGKYSVHAEYGRRDRPNQRHDKTKDGRLGLSMAFTLFNDTIAAKRVDGYTDMAALRPPASIPGAVAVAPDRRPGSLAAALAAFVAATPEVATATDEAMNIIEARVGLMKMRSASVEVRTLLGAILGDIACISQDYVDDALAAVSAVKGNPAMLVNLLSALSPLATSAVKAACKSSAPGESTAQFFVAAFKPVLDSGLM